MPCSPLPAWIASLWYPRGQEAASSPLLDDSWIVVVRLCRRVLHDVGAVLLKGVTQAQHAKLMKRQEDPNAEQPSPKDDDDASNQLCSQLIAPIKHAVSADTLVRVSEEAQCQDRPKAVDAVHRESINNVVHLQAAQQHRASLVQGATDETDDDRLPRLDVGASCRDSNQPCEDAVAEAANIQALWLDHLGAKEEHQEPCHARRQSCVHSHKTCCMSCVRVVQRARASGIEAVPPEPQEEGAEHTEGDTVGIERIRMGLTPAVLARPNDNGTTNGSDPSHHVHDTAAGKIHERRANDRYLLATVICVIQEAIATPDPVDNKGIDDGGHQHSEGPEPFQFRPLCHRATHYRPTCRAESPLKKPKAERGLGIPETDHQKVCAARDLARLVNSTKC
mmetsp:Transcript_89748/g.226427  ORF Transcript_89748/g.226427 Transcript_89748/m.226427 type:complete len:393 (-) Transcript_89748:347-1525(-)